MYITIGKNNNWEVITIEEIFERYEIKKIHNIKSHSGTDRNEEKTVYVVYEVEITYKNGKQEMKRLIVDPNTIDIMSVDEKTRKWFLVEGLFGKNGLINTQKRNDFLFLGKLSVNKIGNYIADRDYLISDEQAMHQLKQQSALQKYESHLKDIKIAFGIEDSTIADENMKSKNYAISDIHGMYGSYIEVLQQLNSNDNLYIVGDVIDRGDNGIKILQDIIKRKENPKNNPNITFIIGNHEIMFLENVMWINQYISNYVKEQKHNEGHNRSISQKQIIEVLCESLRINQQVSDLKYKIYELQNKGNRGQELYNAREQYEQCLARQVNIDRQYKQIIEPLNINSMHLAKFKNWIIDNKGEKTLKDFYSLSVDERNEIYKFLLNSYVILPQQIEQNNVLFVHAMPPRNEEILKQLSKKQIGYTVQDLWNSNNQEMKFMVQERNFETYKRSMKYNFLTICGHTPALGEIKDCRHEGYIRIDAACGHRIKGTHLALYCIDDGLVKYIEEKQDVKDEEKVIMK